MEKTTRAFIIAITIIFFISVRKGKIEWELFIIGIATIAPIFIIMWLGEWLDSQRNRDKKNKE